VATDIQKFAPKESPYTLGLMSVTSDARDLKAVVYTEFNIEGNPQHNFIDLVLECKPEQVTLVPDAIGALTSSAGWDTVKTKPI
jgi:pyridoxine 5-phosphate synthase